MKIVVRLMGGLGNQLFQYAFARAVAHKYNCEFKLDATPFSHYYFLDKYCLSPFNIIENIATDSDMLGLIRIRKHDKMFNVLFNKLRLKKILGLWYFIPKTSAFDPAAFKIKRTTYFEGFWQTELYFKDIEDTIRKEFTLKEPLSEQNQKIAEAMSRTQAVSLHVRRYAPDAIPSFGTCSLEYYQKAIAYVAAHVSNPHFYIFSDNYPWVREHFVPVINATGYSYTLVENPNDKNHEDMILMSKCRHHIIANSSFSWWGAWLNPNKNKIVIAPQTWFANLPKNDTRDLVPKNWIRM